MLRNQTIRCSISHHPPHSSDPIIDFTKLPCRAPPRFSFIFFLIGFFGWCHVFNASHFCVQIYCFSLANLSDRRNRITMTTTATIPQLRNCHTSYLLKRRLCIESSFSFPRAFTKKNCFGLEV
jgi:hypothetical protein